MGLVIFDAFNTLVTAHPEYRRTFLDGLARAGLEPSPTLLSELQATSEESIIRRGRGRAIATSRGQPRRSAWRASQDSVTVRVSRRVSCQPWNNCIRPR